MEIFIKKSRGVTKDPQNLVDQWTLFKPGGDYDPHTTACPSSTPRIKKAIYTSEVHDLTQLFWFAQVTSWFHENFWQIFTHSLPIKIKN